LHDDDNNDDTSLEVSELPSATAWGLMTQQVLSEKQAELCGQDPLDGKKNPISRSADERESEPWQAFCEESLKQNNMHKHIYKNNKGKLLDNEF